MKPETSSPSLDPKNDLYFRGLCDIERRRLEEEEDRILATVLYNITAFMVMMAVNKNEIKLKVISIIQTN